jgi:ferredoxin
MKVRVDRDLCVGIGNCVAVSPSVFKLDAQNKAVVTKISSVNEHKIMEAANSCPLNTIIIEDNDGQQLYP